MLATACGGAGAPQSGLIGEILAAYLPFTQVRRTDKIDQNWGFRPRPERWTGALGGAGQRLAAAGQARTSGPPTPIRPRTRRNPIDQLTVATDRIDPFFRTRETGTGTK